MILLRELNGEELKELTSREGVNIKAIENFLMSMPGANEWVAQRCLQDKAAIFRWDKATIEAIDAGIKIALKTGVWGCKVGPVKKLATVEEENPRIYGEVWEPEDGENWEEEEDKEE